MKRGVSFLTQKDVSAIQKEYLKTLRDGVEDHWRNEIDTLKEERKQTNPYKFLDEPEKPKNKSCCSIS